MTSPEQKKKDYEKDKERVTILVPGGIKDKWKQLSKEFNFPTVSKFIRKAIDSYININSKQTSFTTISELSHDLKEPLTAIQGILYLLIENNRDTLDWGILTKLNKVVEHSMILKKIIDKTLEDFQVKHNKHDILIVDDDSSTNKILIDFFH